MWHRGHTHSGREGTRIQGRAKKREGVCGNVNAQTQVGTERGDGTAQRQGGKRVLQRGRTHLVRKATQPRGRAKRKGGGGVR